MWPPGTRLPAVSLLLLVVLLSVLHSFDAHPKVLAFPIPEAAAAAAAAVPAHAALDEHWNEPLGIHGYVFFGPSSQWAVVARETNANAGTDAAATKYSLKTPKGTFPIENYMTPPEANLEPIPGSWAGTDAKLNPGVAIIDIRPPEEGGPPQFSQLRMSVDDSVWRLGATVTDIDLHHYLEHTATLGQSARGKATEPETRGVEGI